MIILGTSVWRTLLMKGAIWTRKSHVHHHHSIQFGIFFRVSRFFTTKHLIYLYKLHSYILGNSWKFLDCTTQLINSWHCVKDKENWTQWFANCLAQLLMVEQFQNNSETEDLLFFWKMWANFDLMPAKWFKEVWTEAKWRGCVIPKNSLVDHFRTN